MRIAVNLLPFRLPLAGAGRYSQNLLRELVRADPGNRYLLFVADHAAAAFDFPASNVTPFRVSLPRLPAARIAYEQLIFPFQLVRHHADVLFTPSVAIPVAGRLKKVTVIYDMIAEHPEVSKYPPLRRAYVRWMSRYAARHSDAVLTISESSRRELVQYAGIAPGKVSLARPAADTALAPVRDPAELARVRAAYGLPPRFILHLGTLEPGKNLVRLVHAFAELQLRNPSLDAALVLAGPRGWGVDELEAAVRERGGNVHLPGFIAESDLPALYSLADVFVYPSLYEGFGLPPLEAMACGTPVIVSDVSSLPEVLGDTGTSERAGLAVPPHDVSALAGAMEQILADPGLHARLSTAGLARARQFRWIDSAAIARDVLAHVGAGQGTLLASPAHPT